MYDKSTIIAVDIFIDPRETQIECVFKTFVIDLI